MKQLISLLLIISITVISWSSYAKSTVIQVNYSQPSIAVSSMVLTPSLSEQHINEGFDITSNLGTNKSHNFFEIAVVFNEKLQQFIAFFTHFGDDVEEVASNDLVDIDMSPTNNNQTAIQKCKASS